LHDKRSKPQKTCEGSGSQFSLILRKPTDRHTRLKTETEDEC